MIVMRISAVTSASHWTLQLAIYKLELMGIQEVKWDRSEAAGDYTFLCGNCNGNHKLEPGLYVRGEIISAIKTVGCYISLMLRYSECACSV